MLNLREAVPAALKNNLGIAVSRIEKSVVEDTPDIAEAAFDPTFSFESTYDTTGSTPYWRQENSSRMSNQSWNNSAEISKKFSFSISFELLLFN